MTLRTKTMGPMILAATLLAAAPAHAASHAPVAASIAPAGATSRATNRASLRVDVGHRRAAWVGEAVPVTVTAAFRDVDQVTLEGPLRVSSPSVVTSSFPSEPKQWQERVGGVPTLLVRWTGTVTPATAGALELTAELPVRVGFRDPVKVQSHALAPDPLDDEDEDPFGDAFASSLFRRMEEQMRQMRKDVFESGAGSLREEATTLSAKAPSLEARALPAMGRPATFSGAIGHFDVSSFLASNDLRTADPVTLRIVVEGEGDLDRVDLAGVGSSATWKAYPAHAVADPEPAKPGVRSRKVFEQTLVPLTPGAIAVPPVELAAFDPTTNAYVTRASAPIEVTVVPGAAPAAAAAPKPAPSPAPARAVVAPTSRRAWLAIPAALAASLVALAIAFTRRRTTARRTEAKLRGRMRAAAADGALAPFAEAARELIRGHLAKRWGIPAEAVTTRTIRERLGDAAAPLVEALALDSALRFGGGSAAGRDLASLGAAVEASLACAA